MSLVRLLEKKTNKTLFTTPSHGQKSGIYAPLDGMYKIDISENEAYNPQEELIRSQLWAKSIYQTYSTTYLTNGSTSGVIAAVMSCTKVGDKVLIAKNAHPCHFNAVRLAGARALTYEPQIDPEWGVSLETKPEVIENYLKKYDIKTVIITSPTYEGIISDIEEIKAICERHEAYLIVDEAHGALYPFSDKLPLSAVNIADFTVQSLHKTAGGLNPTALLHCNCEIDVKPALDMFMTTSPSYPLLASIEENIAYLDSRDGRKEIDNLINKLDNMRMKIHGCQFFGDDPTKLLIKVPGLSGYELSRILYEDFDIEDEITNDKSTMLLCGIGTDNKKLSKLEHALSKF
ncbi:MAG: aminotransferase class I/II-fold pyridoxal phosphate-dependent enzyme [Cyanobacteriota bacterium]|nr:aminotransferase class I/II-fold pyridoxal phosphate-dependent enzyme [Cyanobacteriota bacterium]MDY6358074.1 aminotransferase class I/II-fold pyridoxal phosphate-dependent enzyme [Cyanobacteriota bacterium]MDY6364730.1 aminotransferase class I/II-fold pyridoxal phosphate-dependent enzyme [Cyanobacteriota bacterium]MDY6383100.1 aminotransferase class I/II-fold pyridoxal phosphate-dependent enzyme [Cyanobacteriota bacterium]